VALRRLRAFRPDAVFSTGGYASFPASLAARLLRKPLVVYLPDVSPGWAVKAEMRLATRMAATADAALAFLPRQKTTVTGYPVRSTFFTCSRQEARRTVGIPDGERLLLVAGASQGATAINGAIFDGLRRLLPAMRIIHVTGQADHALAEGQRLSLGALAGRYEPVAFRDDLPLVMVAADLAVMRAGASVLGELTAAGLPAILVPGMFAGGHQRDNAHWLAEQGAAVVLEEALIGQLPEVILSLVADPGRLERMRDAAQSLARPGAADAIADILLEVAR
jgi:UDP-N-acetylglucosamine--N-acetylmuramyl-(pentapeptide) pyrophosphoryl-undecaprenol N-acetylglucosamine transferase